MTLQAIFLITMIHKLTYEKPQSEVVRLQAPMLLLDVSGKGGNENFGGEKPGTWSDDDLLFNPGGFPGLGLGDLL